MKTTVTKIKAQKQKEAKNNDNTASDASNHNDTEDDMLYREYTFPDDLYSVTAITVQGHEGRMGTKVKLPTRYDSLVTKTFIEISGGASLTTADKVNILKALKMNTVSDYIEVQPSNRLTMLLRQGWAGYITTKSFGGYFVWEANGRTIIDHRTLSFDKGKATLQIQSSNISSPDGTLKDSTISSIHEQEKTSQTIGAVIGVIAIIIWIIMMIAKFSQ